MTACHNAHIHTTFPCMTMMQVTLSQPIAIVVCTCQQVPHHTGEQENMNILNQALCGFVVPNQVLPTHAQPTLLQFLLTCARRLQFTLLIIA